MTGVTGQKEEKKEKEEKKKKEREGKLLRDGRVDGSKALAVFDGAEFKQLF